MSEVPDQNQDDLPADAIEAKLDELSPLVNLLNRAGDAFANPVTNPTTPFRSHLALQPPQQLGDFELLSPIGRGGMGVVYEARQRSLDRIVALKVLPKSVVPNAEQGSVKEPTSQQNLVKRFHVEAKAAGRLHHTNIVSVYGFGEDAGFYFFVMQRIYGRSLERWIQDQHRGEDTVPEDRSDVVQAAARFGFQAASALAYAHGEGIVHRDIKPANLLIDEDENLQVADFGIARVEDSEALTKTSDVVGTLRYMAPEQLIGDSNPQSDLYSLGITIYEVLTGKPAMDEGAIRGAVLLQQRPTGPMPLRKRNPALPVDLCTIIHKAMMPDSGDRYVDASEMADDFQRFLNGQPIRARRLPWWERTSRWVRANPVVSTLALAVIVSLTMTAAVSLWGKREIADALKQQTIAKQSAEDTAELAADAMEAVFMRFSASADAISIGFDATEFSAPTVNRQTAALLQNLLTYYESLAKRRNKLTESPGQISPSVARLHLAMIYKQLGQYRQAIGAFEEAADAITNETPGQRARLLNQIGIAREYLGQFDSSKQYYRDALALFSSPDEYGDDPRVQFEIARSQLLITRRLRPGMGPLELPPREGFLFDPWVGRMQPYGPSRLRPSRQLRPEIADPQYRSAVTQFAKLAEREPNSIPVRLLLANMVRELMQDGLLARLNPEQNRETLVLVGKVQDELLEIIAEQSGAGNDAAARCELVQLLTDFNVFRDLSAQDIDLAIELLEQALPHVEYLVGNFPNVPSYENLAVHTWFKASSVYSKLAFLDGYVSDNEMRQIRQLLRRAIQHKTRLYDHSSEPIGYGLWCCVFHMRLGDTLAYSRDPDGARQAYKDSLEILIEGSDLPGDSPVKPDPLHRRENQDTIQRIAANVILRKLAKHLRPEDHHLAMRLSDEFSRPGLQIDDRLIELTEVVLAAQATEQQGG